MILSRVAVAAALLSLVTGCGSTGAEEPRPSSIPVGSGTWDVTAPAWLLHGTLHVGDDEVVLGDAVDSFVLGATGVYWLRHHALMFTSAAGTTEKAADGRWSNLAVSADRSLLAAVDQAHGPTDQYGTHVIQAAVFDTRSGALVYHTPDQEPEKGADLADLYEETTPALHGVSTERLFFDDATIELADSSVHPTTEGPEGSQVYPGMADTLFPDGYHVGVREEGTRRVLSDSDLYGSARLSPDRSTIFDTTSWPSPAVAYDAATGRRRTIDAPWEHFSLVGFAGTDRFFGIAQKIDENAPDNVLRAQQVVSCTLPELTCTPVSPVVSTEEPEIANFFQTEDVGVSPY